MRHLIAPAAVALCATGALGEQILQLDMNDMGFQSLDEAGNPAPFAGEAHTGFAEITALDGLSAMVGVLIKSDPFGPFVPQDDFGGTLTDIGFMIELDAGAIVGGTFAVDIDGGAGAGGDTYEGVIGAGGDVGGTQTGFAIDGLTLAGAFSDADFGGVDVSDWVNAQGQGDNLEGSFLAFKINPDDTGAGIADVDQFVVVPSPGAAAIALVAGVAGLRRRR